MMMTRSIRCARALSRCIVGGSLFVVVPAVTAVAQANLSTQGFGFSTGQFSSRAQGTGGAIAELDPLSPINPASITLLGSRTLFFQIEPEFRSVKTASGSEQTSTARYPVVFGAIPFGSSWMFTLGSSTLLDRTSSTTFLTPQHLGGADSVAMTTNFHVDGAMNDVRLGAGWTPLTWLRLGLGAHAIVGHNLINVTQSFGADSSRFASFSQSRVLGFDGAAISGGVDLISKSVIASFSARKGGTLKLNAEDTTLTSANVPDRFGASIAYVGIANSTISVRTSHDNWSALGALGGVGLKGVDAWDTSIGAELAGPRFQDRLIYLRGGFRTRTLPFQAAGGDVKENSISGGIGTTLANGRVLGDLAVIHANRTADVGASERAWTISIGISVRP
ncbi:MAG: hypothetical protein ABJF01_10415 [bacterium]